MEFGDMECMKEQCGQLIVARGDRTIEPEAGMTGRMSLWINVAQRRRYHACRQRWSATLGQRHRLSNVVQTAAFPPATRKARGAQYLHHWAVRCEWGNFFMTTRVGLTLIIAGW